MNTNLAYRPRRRHATMVAWAHAWPAAPASRGSPAGRAPARRPHTCLPDRQAAAAAEREQVP